MKELLLRSRPMTKEIMETLEAKGLVNHLAPSRKVLETPENEVGVEYLNSNDQKFGPHTLICVGFNRSIVNMGYHSDKEEFILVNEGRRQKPLILVIGLHPVEAFQELVAAGRLTIDDILAIELKFNDPELSFFTMNSRTPHCEWTTPGAGLPSIFYVTESRDLDARTVDMGDYALKVAYLP
jgi:hypothetical protein